jgi:hypothetical protein
VLLLNLADPLAGIGRANRAVAAIDLGLACSCKSSDRASVE